MQTHVVIALFILFTSDTDHSRNAYRLKRDTPADTPPVHGNGTNTPAPTKSSSEKTETVTTVGTTVTESHNLTTTAPQTNTNKTAVTDDNSGLP